MEKLISTAERLRTVREACESFLTLWTLEQMDIPDSSASEGDSIEMEKHLGGFWRRTMLFDDLSQEP